MNRTIDVPCPTTPDGPRGTLWLHNRYVKKWYMVSICPSCKGVHAPEDIRADRLIVPADAVAAA